MNDDLGLILIGQVEDIELECAEHFEYEGLDYSIFHLNSGFYATQAYCTCNQNGLLSEGNISNDEITCPICSESFSIVSGDPVGESDLTSIKTFEITVENNNLYLNI